MENEIVKEFINESIRHAENSFKRLFHCLEQLDEKQLWWRPNDKMNSTAILTKHICGNMRQWVITSINNTEDKRDRPAEFLNDNKMTKEELISLAAATESDFVDAVKKLNPSRLTERKQIQGYEISLLGAIIHVLTHMEGHVGQIIILTRTQLGENYKVFWVPKTAAQKAEGKSI